MDENYKIIDAYFPVIEGRYSPKKKTKTLEEKRLKEKQKEETMKSIFGEEALSEDGLTMPTGEE